MNDRQYAQYESFVRILAFTAGHSADFPATSPGGRAITDLTRITTALRPLTIGQPGISASPGTEAKEDLVDALREDLKDIARTARAIEAGSPPQPGFATPYPLPRDGTQRSLIAHARSVLALVKGNAALIARFTAYELPADFVTDLEADLAAFDAATDSQADDRISGVEDTATARKLLREGRAAVVQLNASVRNKYRRRPELLAAWRTASRVDRPDAPPPAPPIAPTP
jgi:hypothetical protein